MIRAEAHGLKGGDFEADAVLFKMNEYGAQGWELVSAFDTNMLQGRSRDIILIFKRPLDD